MEVLLVIQIMVAVALVAVVLVQRTAQDGGGLMGGGSTMGGLFTARGSANVITRTTAILATIFILNSLALSYLASRAHSDMSLVDKVANEVAPSTSGKIEKPADVVPSAPQVPVAK